MSNEVSGPNSGFADRRIQAAPRHVPSGVFCYPQVETWSDKIWSSLDHLLTDDVKSLFVAEAPEYVVSDDLSWLNKFISRATGFDADVKSETAQVLRTEFSHFRASHASRVEDLGGYYTGGLKCLRPEDIEGQARQILQSERVDGVWTERFDATIAKFTENRQREHRADRLYFCAVEEELFRREWSAGHYATYGSEYLYCLLADVTSQSTAQRVLKGRGQPTLFVCDIPMDMIREGTLLAFSGCILEYLFCQLVDGMECHSLSVGAGSGFSISRDLPPEQIVGHYHPKTVYDPLSRR